jgi:hypothetical protein
MAAKMKKVQEVALKMEDKDLAAKDVLLLLAEHESECNTRYERIEEKLSDQKAFLEKLDMRMWGIAALIVATAIAERFV